MEHHDEFEVQRLARVIPFDGAKRWKRERRAFVKLVRQLREPVLPRTRLSNSL